MILERRRKRSSFSGLALNYWLHAIAQQKRLFAIILADSAGLVVAASNSGPETEEIAAVVPLLARPGEQGLSMAERQDLPLVIYPLFVDQSSLFLCAVGDRDRGKEGLKLAAEGVRRILACH